MYKLNRRTYAIAVAFSLLILAASAVSAQTWIKELAQGVTFTQIVKSPSGPDDTSVPRVINIVKVDLKAPGVRVKTVLGQDRVWGLDPTRGRETIGSMAKRLNATAVLNTDFCNWDGDPLGLHICCGELISEPYPNRTMFGITSDGKYLFDRLEFDAKVTLPNGKWFPVRGINRSRRQNELVAYTPKYFHSTCTSETGSEAVITADQPARLGVPITGTVAEVRTGLGDTIIPEGAIVLSGEGTGKKFVDEHLTEGASVTIEFNVKGSDTTGWEKVVEATGGTPRLVRNGKISVEIEAEKLQPGFCNVTHPRSAIGVDRDGKLVLVTVDGRQSIATGMPLAELAELMLAQGCVEAMNLDGGGSTTMSTWFGTLNSPSDGTLRALPNAIAVFAEESSPVEVPEFIISPLSEPIVSGGTAQLALLDAQTGEPLAPELANRAVWSINGRTNFVDQSGKVYGVKAGETEVMARLGSRSATLPIKAVAAPPSRLSARLDPDPTGAPNRSTISVSLTDLNGNGIEGRRISVKVTGGVPDVADLMTAADGKVSTGVTWDAAPGAPAHATVTSGDFPPVVLQRPAVADQ